MKKLVMLCAVLFFGFVSNIYAGVATFEDLSLSSGSYWNGDDDGSGYGTYGGFTSGDNYFVNYQYTGWNYWDGFAYSNMTDTTTAGYTNQFSAVTGTGFNNSSNYAIAYTSMMSGQASQTYNGYTTGEYAQVVKGFYVTNTTYAYLSMLEGDGIAKAFGGDNGTDEDWFLLTIYALDENYGQTGEHVDFYLADYRGDEDYIINAWTWVDLTGLGAVYGLEFSLSSSDNSDYGMNTPAYFAMDNLETVPVPGTFLILASGILWLSGLSRKRA